MSDPFDTRIAEIAGRAEAATEGPWVSQLAEIGFSPRRTLYLVSTEDALPESWQAVAETGFARPEANAAFIAHAREDIPFLLAALQHAREALREIEWVDRGGYFACPGCGNIRVARTDESVGHAPGCPVGAALAPEQTEGAG